MSELKKQINYAVVCVNEFAKTHNLTAKSAFQYLYQNKAIEFIKENYAIEHTLSIADAIEDMGMICRNNGGQDHFAYTEGKDRTVTRQEQLIEYVTQDLIELIVMNQKVEYDEAMNLLYNSETFDKLSDVETGLYSESPAYVYGIFQGEQNFGKIVQAEL